MIGQTLIITAAIVMAALFGACFLCTAIKNYRKEKLFIACLDAMFALYWVAYMFKLVFKL